MIIEQIVEHELGGLGYLVVHVFLHLIIFMTKKISKANLREKFYFLPKIMQDFKRVLDVTSN